MENAFDKPAPQPARVRPALPAAPAAGPGGSHNAPLSLLHRLLWPAQQSGPVPGSLAALTARTPAAAAAHSPSTPAAVAGTAPREVRAIQRSLYSFKVLTECPIIIVLLFQLYRSFNETHVEPFVPLVFKVCRRHGPQAQPDDGSAHRRR